MRRMLAITLLLAFGSPFILSVFSPTADPEANLPDCCRSHGAHHCIMIHGVLAAGSGPAVVAPPCPLYPAAATLPGPATASLSTLPSLSAAASHSEPPESASQPRAWTLPVSANPKRGPPTLLA